MKHYRDVNMRHLFGERPGALGTTRDRNGSLILQHEAVQARPIWMPRAEPTV